MSWKSNLLKRVMLALFFFLSSCSQKCTDWQYQETVTCCHYYNSGRLIHFPQNHFRGVSLEISRGHTGLRAYVNVYSLSLPKEDEDPTKTMVTISSEDGSFDVIAERLEGGQRLLLPLDATNAIIKSLLECKTVCISTGRFKSEISPYGFSKYYHQLMGI
ncbi:MAG: hypothetical protein K940chlam7_00833 [Chlamydiae bacterium]|nr:hypothetical protein [Chlamydiota bacterium]